MARANTHTFSPPAHLWKLRSTYDQFHFHHKEDYWQTLFSLLLPYAQEKQAVVYRKIYLRPNRWRVRLQLHSQYAQRSKGVLSGNEHTGTGTAATLRLNTFSPGGRHAPDGLHDLFHTLRTGTIKGEVFGKDVKIKTGSEPPLQLSKLKKEKVRLERAIDRLNKLFLYSEKAMSESEYLTQKIQLSDSLEEVEDKLAFLASEGSLQQSITDDEFIAKASNFILSQKLTDRNYISFQSLSATVSPEVLDSFLSSIIDNIVFKDGAVNSITFRNGLSHTFIYREKPEV